jgi:hypothetical protein
MVCAETGAAMLMTATNVSSLPNNRLMPNLLSGKNQTEDSGPNGRNLRSTVDPVGSIRLILSTSVDPHRVSSEAQLREQLA